MLVIGGILLVWLVLVVLVLAALREAALADEAHARLRGHVSTRSHPEVVAALAVVAMSSCVPSQADAASTDTRCDDAEAVPDFARPRQALDATVCLINERRLRRDVPALQVDPRLADAAHRHAEDMVAHGYFSHVSPGGSTMVDRLRRARYISRRCAWRVGETLAWGSGSAVTPGSRVRAWMQSRRHRKVLVDPAYRDVGIGIVEGRPDGAGDGVVYVADFGRRDCP